MGYHGAKKRHAWMALSTRDTLHLKIITVTTGSHPSSDTHPAYNLRIVHIRKVTSGRLEIVVQSFHMTVFQYASIEVFHSLDQRTITIADRR
jgi:hypothetical protein